jgi:hypothetical protein
MFTESNELLKQVFVKYPQDTETFVMHRVNGLDIPFDPRWQRIGINLSGGADSSSLCMILANIIRDNNYECQIHLITYVRCWETRPWQEPISVDVYNKLKEMFPGIVVDRHEGYIPPELEYGVVGRLSSEGNAGGENKLLGTKSGDMIYGASFTRYIANRYKLQAVFNATGQNPQDPVFQTHHDRAPDRELSVENGRIGDLIHFAHSGEFWFVTPYRFVQKDWMIAQYHKFDAVELYHTTRSCEGDLNELPIKEAIPSLQDYHHGMDIPICGVCFWCCERSWAESKVEEVLKKLDE